MDNYITKNMNLYLKGIGIILMLIHHLFTFPDWYIDSINYPELQQFAIFMNDPTRICVAMFAFLTGWSYAYNKNKILKYSLKKLKNLLLNYWFIYFILFIIAYILGFRYNNVLEVVLELFGLNPNIMTFCWYIYFYMTIMLLLPNMYKLLNNKILIIVFILLPIFISNYLNLLIANNLIYKVLKNICSYIPIVLIGYIMANYNIYSRFYDKIFNKSNVKIFNLMLMYCLVIITFISKYYLGIFDNVLIISLFMYSLTNVINSFNLGIRKILKIVGENSMYIWFIHCAFFNVAKKYIQPIAFFPKNPILVFIWVLCLTLILSIAIKLLKEKINIKHININNT